MTKLLKYTTVNATFNETDERVTNALQEQGFGVLTEINLQQTLKQKLDVDTDQYAILDACNPDLAYQALQEGLSIGLLLPCNLSLPRL